MKALVKAELLAEMTGDDLADLWAVKKAVPSDVKTADKSADLLVDSKVV